MPAGPDDAVAPRAIPLAALRLGLARRMFSPFPPFVGARLVTQALRAAGVRIGAATVFWAMPTLVGEGEPAARLQIGTHCGFNARCHFELDADIVIRDHVSVGHEVMFLTRTRDGNDPGNRGRVTGASPIEIGAGAWLGARCTILPGVKIGAGAVIGASVCVAQDVPENMMVLGSRKVSIARWR
jgi:maltose O-acetyltransferase